MKRCNPYEFAIGLRSVCKDGAELVGAFALLFAILGAMVCLVVGSVWIVQHIAQSGHPIAIATAIAVSVLAFCLWGHIKYPRNDVWVGKVARGLMAIMAVVVCCADIVLAVFWLSFLGQSATNAGIFASRLYWWLGATSCVLWAVILVFLCAKAICERGHSIVNASTTAS